jgi:hypothetical protein
MGLDIACDDIYECVGPYSGVTKQRIDWIKATIEYLENLKIEMNNETEKITDEEEADNHKRKLSKLDELLVALNKSFSSVKSSSDEYQTNEYLQILSLHINNELIGKCRDYLCLFGLTGLVWWVVHSDCAGYLSPGQSHDIIETLNKIVKYMDSHYFKVSESGTDSSADTTSADNTNADNTNADTTSADTTSTDTTSADTTSADNTSADNTSADTTSADNTSADNTNADPSQDFYLYPIFKQSVKKNLNVKFC